MLIGILGRKYVGKDTCADYLVEKYGYNKMSLAEPLKQACHILFDFNDEQLYGDLKETIDERWNITPRIIFQYLGTDVFRKDINKIIPNIDEDFWIRLLINKYNSFRNIDRLTNVVISDVRFENEIKHIRQNGGKIVKIIRRHIKNEDAHISEKDIDNIQVYDCIIENDSTIEEYYVKIDRIISYLKR